MATIVTGTTHDVELALATEAHGKRGSVVIE
jgi:hypothetical protein